MEFALAVAVIAGIVTAIVATFTGTSWGAGGTIGAVPSSTFAIDT